MDYGHAVGDMWVSPARISLSTAQLQRLRQFAENRSSAGTMTPYGQYMHGLGAIRVTALAMDLNLSTENPDQVRITRIRAVTQCGPPADGTMFYSPPAGPAEPIGKIGFDLDRPVPIAEEVVPQGDGDPILKGDFFADNVQYIAKNDGWAYRVTVRTFHHYCQFRLQVDATSDGRSQTITVDDNGRPFAVSAVDSNPPNNIEFPTFPKYGKVYIGGVVAPGPGWYPRDPKTYNPNTPPPDTPGT